MNLRLSFYFWCLFIKLRPIQLGSTGLLTLILGVEAFQSLYNIIPTMMKRIFIHFSQALLMSNFDIHTITDSLQVRLITGSPECRKSKCHRCGPSLMSLSTHPAQLSLLIVLEEGFPWMSLATILFMLEMSEMIHHFLFINITTITVIHGINQHILFK